MTDLNLKFMQLADQVAQWSKDRSSKVGAIIVAENKVISIGYNGLPINCDNTIDDRYEHPLKSDWFHHAEENAIINAARYGEKTMNAEMYINWFPCSKCAGMIVNSGIKKIYCDKMPDLNHPRYGESFKIAMQKLNEGHVEIVYMNYDANRQ